MEVKGYYYFLIQYKMKEMNQMKIIFIIWKKEPDKHFEINIECSG